MTVPTSDPAPDRPAVAHAVVVGGGIAGLAAAHELHRLLGDQVRVTVLEASDRVGGALRTGEVGGVPVDLGAESLLARRPEAVDLARAVGLGEDLTAPATTRAALWSRRALRPLPTGTLMGVPGDLRALAASGVLSTRELARVGLDPYLPGRPLTEDVAVGTWVADRLGDAVVDRLVEPLLGGVYAGRARELSLQMTVPALYAAGREDRSLLAAVRGVQQRTREAVPPVSGTAPAPVFAGVVGGVGRLPGAVAAASGATVRTGVRVTALHRDEHGWELTATGASGPERRRADAVVLAVPAAPAADLLAPLLPVEARALGALPYASVALVTMLLGPDAPVPEGSGFLVPAVEARTIKAATFSGRKWAWSARAAQGRHVVRASVGRAGDEADLALDDDVLVRRAGAEVGEAVGAGPLDPVAATVTRWTRGLPQYAPGHADRVGRLRAALVAHPGLAVCGAAYDGVGVPACIAGGQGAAARVAGSLAAVGRSQA